MTHTIVAIFDIQASAKAALEGLANAGFERASTRLSRPDESELPVPQEKTGGTPDVSITDSLKDFFAGLFEDTNRQTIVPIPMPLAEAKIY